MSRLRSIVALGIVVSLLTAGGLLAAKQPAHQAADPFAAEKPPARQPSPSALHKAPARKASPPAAVKSLGKKSRSQTAKCRHLRSGEAAIAEALGKPIDLQFAETPLADVIDNLKDYCGIEIQLDNRALCDVGIGTDTPVTMDLSLRAASLGTQPDAAAARPDVDD